jgi:DNA repair exonuclease SbcCD ATPase subunit
MSEAVLIELLKAMGGLGVAAFGFGTASMLTVRYYFKNKKIEQGSNHILALKLVDEFRSATTELRGVTAAHSHRLDSHEKSQEELRAEIGLTKAELAATRRRMEAMEAQLAEVQKFIPAFNETMTNLKVIAGAKTGVPAAIEAYEAERKDAKKKT